MHGRSFTSGDVCGLGRVVLLYRAPASTTDHISG